MSEASEETRVGIKAAFPVKKRELNGLNRVAAYLNDNRAERIPVVGYVEFVKHTDTIEGDELTVALVVVEPVVNAQGRSVKGYAEDVARMIEDMRRSAGKAPVADTLFDAGTKKELDAELDGQTELPIGGHDIRDCPGSECPLYRTGEHSPAAGVPEKSGEELAAERAEGVPADQQTVTDKPEPDPGQLTDEENALRESAAGITPRGGKPAGGKTDGQKAFEADVVAAVTGTGGRKPRGATVRPTADPFTPTDAA